MSSHSNRRRRSGSLEIAFFHAVITPSDGLSRRRTLGSFPKSLLASIGQGRLRPKLHTAFSIAVRHRHEGRGTCSRWASTIARPFDPANCFRVKEPRSTSSANRRKAQAYSSWVSGLSRALVWSLKRSMIAATLNGASASLRFPLFEPAPSLPVPRGVVPARPVSRVFSCCCSPGGKLSPSLPPTSTLGRGEIKGVPESSFGVRDASPPAYWLHPSHPSSFA